MQYASAPEQVALPLVVCVQLPDASFWPRCNQTVKAWCAGPAQALEGAGIQLWILGWISQWQQRAPSSTPKPVPQQRLHRCASLLLASDQKVSCRSTVCGPVCAYSVIHMSAMSCINGMLSQCQRLLDTMTCKHPCLMTAAAYCCSVTRF